MNYRYLLVALLFAAPAFGMEEIDSKNLYASLKRGTPGRSMRTEMRAILWDAESVRMSKNLFAVDKTKCGAALYEALKNNKEWDIEGVLSLNSFVTHKDVGVADDPTYGKHCPMTAIQNLWTSNAVLFAFAYDEARSRRDEATAKRAAERIKLALEKAKKEDTETVPDFFLDVDARG